MNFNALNNPIEDFDAGIDKDKNLKHNNDIKPIRLVGLHIDYRQIGVAGDDSWGAIPQLIKPVTREYKYSFTLVPVYSSKEVEAMAKLKY